MKKKYITSTYLKDVQRHELTLINNEDHYISIKKIIEVNKKFVSKDGITLIDNNFYIIEVVPLNENYCVRIFINDKKEILEYYIDITYKNSIDEITRIPYYIDLYLDIIYINQEIKILDEDELFNAVNDNIITYEDYNMAIKTKDKIIEEITNSTNKYINMNVLEYIK